MTLITQQGDIKLFHTSDNGDINVEDGITEMDGGLETMAYLCLFGGNEDDDGRSGNNLSYWGNITIAQPLFQYRSEFQYLTRNIALVTGNIAKLEDAANRDLAVFVSEGIADSVDVDITITGKDRIDVDVSIEAEGELTQFTFTQNWSPVTIQEQLQVWPSAMAIANNEWAAKNSSISLPNVVQPTDTDPAPYIIDILGGSNATAVSAAQFLKTGAPLGDELLSFSTGDYYTTGLAVAQPCTLIWLGSPTLPGSTQNAIGDTNAGLRYDDSGLGVAYGGTELKSKARIVGANDTYDGSSLNTDRWTVTNSNGTRTVAGGVLTMSVTGTGTINSINNQVIIGTGEFEIKTDFDNLSTLTNNSAVVLRIYYGANFYQLYIGKDGSNKRLRVGKLEGGFTVLFDEANASTSGELKITRLGTDLKFYLDGSLKYTATISAGQAFDEPRLEVFVSDPGTISIDWDNFSATDKADGTGNELEIAKPWTGFNAFHAVLNGSSSRCGVNGANENIGDAGTGSIAALNIGDSAFVHESKTFLVYNRVLSPAEISDISIQLLNSVGV